MRRLRAWLMRLGGLFDKERRDRELAGELESHLQMHIEDNLWAGMTPEEARRDALMKLGGLDGVQEACRDQRGLYEPFRDTVRKDRVALLRLQDYLAANTRFSLLLCQGAVGFVLLIACANVANLLLARATRRQREIAVRVALGAGRLRIIRQLLTESVLLALLGSALGLLLAFGLKDAIRSLLPDLGNIPSVGIDGAVLAFTFLAAVLTGLIFGLAPALEASRVSLNESLREGSRSMTGGRKPHRLQGMLVIAEVAVALVLLVGAGLLLKCFFHVRGLDTGFRTDRLLTMTMELSGKRYREGPAQTAYREWHLTTIFYHSKSTNINYVTLR